MENNFKELLEEKYSTDITFNDEKSNEFMINDFEKVSEILNSLKENGFSFLADLTAVDYKEYIEVVYQIYSFSDDRNLTAKVKLDHENPQVESATEIWKTAEWLERETFDLVGVKFLNHPNLQRILTWDDFEGHPLRKDFEYESGRK